MNERIDSSIIVARCHEIQTSLGSRNVPEYDQLSIIGMATKVALHIRGLPLIEYETLKLVCAHFLEIPAFVVERIVKLLAEIEFVYLQQQGNTIKSLLPNVPYYEDLYEGIGEYVENDITFSEAEQLALALVDRLAASPENVDRLRNQLGSDGTLFNRSIDVGKEGGFLYVRRHRGRDIVVNPIYFSENVEIFADHVAATNSIYVAELLNSLKQYQGWPLSLIMQNAKIANIDIDPNQIHLLERLAQDGVVKPPTITTRHSGENHFIFTPTPYASNVTPTKREVYEKAMAIVAAIRQGQLLPEKFAIRSPGAVLNKLKTDLKLSRATTEFSQQYRNLVHLRVGQLIHVGYGYHEFQIIDTPDNREALQIAYDLVTTGEASGIEVDDNARRALQADHKYVESLIASAQLRDRPTIALPDEQAFELETILLRGTKL